MKNIVKSSLIILGLMAGGLAEAQDQARVVTLAEIPAAAQKTMLSKTTAVDDKFKLGQIQEVTEDGETRYDTELIKARMKRAFSVAPDGTVVSWQMFVRELPIPVRNAIKEQIRDNKDKLGEIDRVTDEGMTAFDVQASKGEREFSFSVSEEGRMLTLDVTLAETPEPVQKEILAKAAGSIIKSIARNTEDEDGYVAYDVEVQQGAVESYFSVSPDGKLLND
jgi:hypothetical protein